jgi:hypothetical protein
MLASSTASVSPGRCGAVCRYKAGDQEVTDVKPWKKA